MKKMRESAKLVNKPVKIEVTESISKQAHSLMC